MNSSNELTLALTYGLYFEYLNLSISVTAGHFLYILSMTS